ncbi:hypothetical protein [Mycolicibacterium mucogenicum]|uniref:Uncharacterized protein n=1 Tax=Mycolicibacterium mucogenicum TaxID=56689 RepID=A0A4R5WD09_MYCMU|nr:hypothetical protein [Mycolicibacterium mucogenicum]TDK86715.1 hypothetical protein EUA03_19270 [Mycolicibacterium mucogenicum]
MAAVTSLADGRIDRADQLEQLRRKIAEMSGPAGLRGRDRGRPEPVPRAAESLLESSDLQSELLPDVLPRGTVAVLSGARSLPLRMVAAVTASGGYAAIVGQPKVGLLAAVEMGADLERIALIPDPGPDPVEVAAVLMDGLDLVLLGLGGKSVPAGRARVVASRARQRECTLLVTDGDWPGASARLEARVRGYEVVGAGAGDPVPGCGRIGRVRLDTRARGRSMRPLRAVGG